MLVKKEHNKNVQNHYFLNFSKETQQDGDLLLIIK
jgi:hypothetical protein